MDQTETGADEALRVAAQALLAEVQPHLGLQGDVTMFVMDVPPDVPPQYAPVVIAEAKQAKQQNTDRTIGVCKLISNRPEERLSAVNSMSPVLGVYAYLTDYEKAFIDEATYKSATISLLQAPEHGTLEIDSTGGAGYFVTTPDYVGPDRATLLVGIGQYKIKVLYHFKVMQGVPPAGEQGRPTEDKRFCPNGRVWKISLNPDDPNAPIYTFEHPSQLTSPYAGLSNVNLTFGTLAPGALGQTVGDTITLDPNAAGSVTHLLELSSLGAGIAAGTGIHLMFDLIGFGATGSQVTINDVRLISNMNTAPVATDDTVTTAEDQPIVINVRPTRVRLD